MDLTTLRDCGERRELVIGNAGTPAGPRAPRMGWRGRGAARWKHGLYSVEALAEQKRVRELLTQSRELLKQMQAG